MSADAAAFLLICVAAPAVTLCPLIYAFRPFYKSLVGWGLMLAWTGLGLLVDISLLYMVFGDDYPGRDAVRLSVYLLIVTGAYVSLIALCWNVWRNRPAPKPPEGY